MPSKRGDGQSNKIGCCLLRQNDSIENGEFKGGKLDSLIECILSDILTKLSANKINSK